MSKATIKIEKVGHQVLLQNEPILERIEEKIGLPKNSLKFENKMNITCKSNPAKLKDVAGLLILRSEYRTKYSWNYIKNKDKSFKYSIIYLKEFSPEFAKFNMGDISFMSRAIHGEDAYFYTVYDEDVIELFKGKVPIITCK